MLSYMGRLLLLLCMHNNKLSFSRNEYSINQLVN